MAGKLYTLRYRRGHIGATTSFVQVNNPTGDPAKDKRIAEEIGKAYCNQEINMRYIGVVEAVVADESLIDSQLLDSIINPPQRERRQPDSEIELDVKAGRLRPADDPNAETTDAEEEELADDDEEMNVGTPKKRGAEPEEEAEEEKEEQEEPAPVRKRKRGKS